MDVTNVIGSTATAAGATPPGGAATASNSSTDATTQTFLELLVAQIKNQDPTQPMDGTQFLTQLAQFNQLEQLIGINQGVQQLDAATQQTGSQSSTTQTPTPASSSGAAANATQN